MSNDLQTIIPYCKAINLLYAEDNEEVRNFTMELLSRFFDNITVACDGEEGLELFKQKSIDLVISDVNMPKMCGITMSTLIKEINSNTPIVLLSAHNEDTFKEKTEHVRIDWHLKKPINFLDFFEVLKNLAHSDDTHKKMKNND